MELRRTEEGLAFRAPELLRDGPLDDDLLGRVVQALGVEGRDIVAHQWVDNGPGWAAVRLGSAQQVLDLEPDETQICELMIGVVGAYPEGAPHAVEVRAFAGRAGIREDPITGSLNAGLAQWLTGAGMLPSTYVASQGARVGRRARSRWRRGVGRCGFGGRTVTCIEGTVEL